MEKNISLETDPYEQAINMADIARVYFYMGKPNLGRQKFDEVLEFIQSKGIETSSYLLFYDGLAYLYADEIEKAIERFDEGFLLDPDQNFSLYGQIYKSIFLNDRPKAMELIRTNFWDEKITISPKKSVTFTENPCARIKKTQKLSLDRRFM